MGRARIFLLVLTILAAAVSPAAAEDVPGYQSTYAIVRARFVPKEALPMPDGPDPYVGVHVRGEIRVTRVLAGKPDATTLTTELWLPKMGGPLDVFLLLEKRWEGATVIAGWSPAAKGFCVEPEQAPDTTPDDILHVRKLYPCKP
jgi:hypothetical protein